ncbi:hypothetical protein FACS189425_10430 [Clostridia bacterium]|nr:hypothetical protein FACS189425_10430 [Clostridia bacterium]
MMKFMKKLSTSKITKYCFAAVFALCILATSATALAAERTRDTNAHFPGDFANDVIYLYGDMNGIDINNHTTFDGPLRPIDFAGNNPVEAVALSLLALYFVIEVVTKSTSIDKISVEMIVKLLLRLLIAKILVSSAANILTSILGIIDGIAIRMMDVDFGGFGRIQLPIGGNIDVSGTIPAPNPFGVAADAGGALIETAISGAVSGIAMAFELEGLAKLPPISAIIAGAFKLGVPIIIRGVIDAIFSISTGGMLHFYVPLSMTELKVWGALLAANIVITEIINAFTWVSVYFTLFMRNLEIIILSILAPLAMAGFVTDEFKGTTKKFVLQFATTCVQGVVIIIICRVMNQIMGFHADDLLEGFAVFLTRVGIVGYGTIFGPIQALVANAVYPILTSMLIGKSRSVAQAIVGG